MNEKQLYEYALQLFEKKFRMDSLWQEISEQFYPERADFTYQRELGDEFADHLMTSYPVLVRRDLSEQIGTMLRPVATNWFRSVPTDPEREDDNAKRWLEASARIQYKAMYDPAAMLTRAAKEADNDYVTFGQFAMESQIAFGDEQEGPHLLHRCWHLRDMAWVENQYGRIGSRFRKWRPTAQELYRMMGNRPGSTVHPKVIRLATGTRKQPFTKVDCMHMIVERDLYDGGEKNRQPWVSIWYDWTNKHVISATPDWSYHYVIGRWHTQSGSQYAYSPATIVGLPDARLIQAMGRTLLEAGEKLTNPPMIATDEVIRSDVSIYPGGITWVDRDYDEKLGAALRPMTTDAKGMPFGLEMIQDVRTLLWSVFYLNKLNLPQRAPEMTAYEVGQRIQQYIRDALPIFEPMEMEYNGQLCELDFNLLLRAGAFGSAYDMPPSLQGAQVTFRFTSPLHDTIEEQKSQKFLEMRALLAEAVQMDQSTLALPDAKVAFRDALSAAGIPMHWIRTETTVQQIEDATRAAAEAEAALASMETGSKIAKNLADAQATSPELGATPGQNTAPAGGNIPSVSQGAIPAE